MSEPINPSLIAAISDVIKQDERAKLLKDSLIEALAIEAIESDNLENHEWLEQKLNELTAHSMSITAAPKFDPLKDIEISIPSVISCEDDLSKVLTAHQEWISSVLDPNRADARGRANLQGCNLSGFNLEGVNLSCADLRNANFQGANLRKANLSRARLQKAILRDADLTHANLRKAHLDETDLRDAILDEADVRGTDMTHAILRDADLSAKLLKAP